MLSIYCTLFPSLQFNLPYSTHNTKTTIEKATSHHTVENHVHLTPVNDRGEKLEGKRLKKSGIHLGKCETWPFKLV